MTDVSVSRGEQTRERLLDIAQQAILEKGFGATSIEEIVSEAGISKNGFFYHFKDKNELAKALLTRFLDQDKELMDGIFDRAEALSDDPLHAFLIGLKLFAETMADLPELHPGCLVAVVCYQERLFDKEVRDLNAEGVMTWRVRFLSKLEAIATKYPPKEDVDLEALADMLSTLVEGGIILQRALHERRLIAGQVMLFRSYMKLLFSPD